MAPRTLRTMYELSGPTSIRERPITRCMPGELSVSSLANRGSAVKTIGLLKQAQKMMERKAEAIRFGALLKKLEVLTL